MRRLIWIVVPLTLVGLIVGYLGCGGSGRAPMDQVLGSGKGSVKADLKRHWGPGPDVIGWAILNRLPSRDINVLIHVEDGLPNTSYTVSVYACGHYVDGTGTTNRQGKGNVRLTLSPERVYSSEVWVDVYQPAAQQYYFALLMVPWKRDSQASPPGPGIARSGVPFGDPSRVGLR